MGQYFINASKIPSIGYQMNSDRRNPVHVYLSQGRHA
jgi:hypothetical protein